MQRIRRIRLCPQSSEQPPGAAVKRSEVAAARGESGFCLPGRRNGATALPAEDTAALAAHYEKYGFVVVRGMLSKAEAESVLTATRELIDNAPAERGGTVDRHGRQCKHPGAYAFTDPVKADDARTYLVPGQGLVLNRISSPMPMAPAFRHVYGNPQMLRAVERIYGSDFCPFAESIVLKNPHDGAGFQFHQDALRAGPFEQGQHSELGLNCGIYLTDSTLATGCLWVIPETHRRGRIDIEQLPRWSHAQVEAGELPEGAVPVEVDAGDCIFHSRCVVHGSLPNLSAEQRVTLYVGWFPWNAVSHNLPEAVRGRRKAITTAVALRSSQVEFSDEDPFDISTQEQLIRGDDCSTPLPPQSQLFDNVDEAAASAQVAEIFAAPTLSLLPVV